jgi:hypothetical protein
VVVHRWYLRLEEMIAQVLHTQRCQRACTFAYSDDGGDASRLRYQSQLELVCYTRL